MNKRERAARAEEERRAEEYTEERQRAAGQAKRAKKKRRARRRLLALALVLAALCAVGLWAWSRVRPPEQAQAAPPSDAQRPVSGTEGQPPASGADAPEDAPLRLRENVYTILLIGQRDGNTDTLMAAMLDLNKGEMNVVSIPRDTVVDVDRRVPKINGAYNNAGGGAAGIEQLLDEMTGLLGYRPASYACINMQGFVDLVDAIGGVEFDVPVRMYKPAEGIDLQPGLQTLDGEDALAAARFRGYTSDLMDKIGINHDDYGRMQMQQRLLMALAEQTLTADNIGKIPQFLDIASKNLVTDLDAGNIAWFAGQVKKIGSAGLHFHTLPTVSVNYQGDGAARGYYENLRHEEAMTLLNEVLNPYDGPLTDDMVDHRILE